MNPTTRERVLLSRDFSRLPQMKRLLAGYWGLNIASKKTPSKPVTCFVFVVVSVHDETYKRSHGLSSQAFH